jgi:hypothetical protein
MAVFLLTGVVGVRVCAVCVETLIFAVCEAVPLLSNKDGCGCATSSSGSTSSRRRSAALCACSALARKASSTTGCGTFTGSEAVFDDGFNTGWCPFEVDDCESVRDLDPVLGGNLSYGEEKEMRFVSSISSESPSSGRGIATAVRRSSVAGSVSSKSGKYTDWRVKGADCCSSSEKRCEAGEGGVTFVGGGGGGGEDGSAVCMARRSTAPRGGEENGAGTTRGPGYDTELLESPDDVRECDLVPALPEMILSPAELLRILERGGAVGELGAAFPDTLPVDREGESERFGGDMVRAADVAWCRRVGGAVAMALALARLAAMAAATLLFFAVGVVG